LSSGGFHADQNSRISTFGNLLRARPRGGGDAAFDDVSRTQEMPARRRRVKDRRARKMPNDQEVK